MTRLTLVKELDEHFERLTRKTISSLDMSSTPRTTFKDRKEIDDSNILQKHNDSGKDGDQEKEELSKSLQCQNEKVQAQQSRCQDNILDEDDKKSSTTFIDVSNKDLDDEKEGMEGKSLHCLTDISDEDDKTLQTTFIETPTNSFPNSEDDYNLVYSSDDDSALSQTSPVVKIEDVQGLPNLDAFQSFRTTTSTNKYDNQSLFDVANLQGQSPLTIASMNCSIEAMKIFISKGFDVNLRDMNGSTPLHYICMHESNDEQQICLRLLLENGAYVNIQDEHGKTPLHIAASNNSTVNIESLLSCGACPTIQDYEGNLPLHEVTKSLNIEAIEKLSKPNLNQEIVHQMPSILGKGGEDDSSKTESVLNSRSLEIWNRFFDNAINGTNTGSDNDISTFSNDSGEILEKTYEITYPLHNAIYTNDTNLTKDLIDCGYHDINQIDENKNTPLHIAAFKNDLTTIRLLVTNGARIDCEYNAHNQTPLSICLSREYRECTHFLLTFGRRESAVHTEEYYPKVIMNSGNFTFLIEYAKFFLKSICKYLTHDGDTLSINSKMEDHRYDILPEDVAIALNKARQNKNLNLKQLDPPEDVQIALKKAGIITQK